MLAVAGLAAGMALLTRRTLGHLIVLNAAVLPLVLFLAWIQSRLYGSVIASGYGNFDDLFTLANIPANLAAYAGRLLRGEWPALVLLAASVVAAVSGALGAMPVALRPYVVVTTPAAVAAFNVNIAGREQAFNLRRYEARYREAGEYAAASLPSHAVILAVQQGASARYYTGLPVVRWDLLRADLDTAVTELQALGRSPVLLVEDWEAADLHGRFPQSEVARLDWQPRADFGTTTRVRLYDVRDRAASRVPTDRLPSLQLATAACSSNSA